MSAICDVSFDEMAVALSYVNLVGGAPVSASAPVTPASTAREAPKSTPPPAPKVEAPAPAQAALAPPEASPAPTEASKPPPETEKKADEAADDDMDDLFGDDEEASEAPKQESLAEKMAAVKAEKAKKKKVDKSQIVFEVKPWDAEQDLKSLFFKITEVGLEGLTWGQAYNLVPVAFGVKKLVLSCVVEDDKVGVEDITDIIEKFEDEVQSVDMATMNRL